MLMYAEDGGAVKEYQSREYQAVVVKLARHTREDEDTLTDLLNERSRGGWEPTLMSQDEHRLTIFFHRAAEA